MTQILWGGILDLN